MVSPPAGAAGSGSGTAGDSALKRLSQRISSASSLVASKPPSKQKPPPATSFASLPRASLRAWREQLSSSTLNQGSGQGSGGKQGLAGTTGSTRGSQSLSPTPRLANPILEASGARFVRVGSGTEGVALTSRPEVEEWGEEGVSVSLAEATVGVAGSELVMPPPPPPPPLPHKPAMALFAPGSGHGTGPSSSASSSSVFSATLGGGSTSRVALELSTHAPASATDHHTSGAGGSGSSSASSGRLGRG
ncbi:unnamed protein product, partial [Discosporangium mesarthrocarpum]